MDGQSLIIGITGGIGSGKSAVADSIRSRGFKVLSMDDSARELMAESPEIREKLGGEFGGECYLPDGTLNKAFLAAEVFAAGNEERLAKLNSIVHPYVIQKMIDECEKLVSSGENLIFVESALIYEAELDEGFDYVVVVDAPKETRVERVLRRGGISREEVLRRMESQLSSEEKIRVADFVIDNSKTLAELEKAVDFIMAILPGLPPKEFTEATSTT